MSDKENSQELILAHIHAIADASMTVLNEIVGDLDAVLKESLMNKLHFVSANLVKICEQAEDTVGFSEIRHIQEKFEINEEYEEED